MTSALLLLAVLLAALALLWALCVRAYAGMLMSPPRMTDGKAAYVLKRVSPMDVGMPFEDLTFEVSAASDQSLALERSSSVNHPSAGDAPEPPRRPSTRHPITGTRRIAAWWIPAEGSNRMAVLVHGYADAKVGALAWAGLFRQLGFNLLLPDLRAHGESFGKWTTGGVREADDLAALLDDIKTRCPGQTREIVLFGASLGASAVARLAGLRDDIRAVVLDSPVASFEEGALGHARLMSLPEGVVVRPALWLGERWTGVRFEQAAVVKTLPLLRCPAMVVLPVGDEFAGERGRRMLVAAFDAHRNAHPEAALWEPAVPHLLATVLEPLEYQQRLAEFLQRAPEAITRTTGAGPGL